MALLTESALSNIINSSDTKPNHDFSMNLPTMRSVIGYILEIVNDVVRLFDIFLACCNTIALKHLVILVLISVISSIVFSARYVILISVAKDICSIRIDSYAASYISSGVCLLFIRVSSSSSLLFGTVLPI